MAKSRNRNFKRNKVTRKISKRIRNKRRVAPVNARRSLPLYRVSPTKPVNLLDIEDRRSFNPTNKVVGYSGTVVVDNRNTVKKQTKAPLAYRRPKALAVCLRRSIRKEVIFAKNKAGKTGQKKPKFNYLSRISCRS